MAASYKQRRHGRLSDADFARIVQDELHLAAGGESSKLGGHWRRAQNAYRLERRGDEREGRSKVQASDLPDMVEATIADIMPSLCVEGVVAFRPLREDDEQQADQETAAVEDAIWQGTDGEIELETCIRDALLMRLTWAHVEHTVDESETTVELFGLTEDAVGLALTPEREGDEIEAISQEQMGETPDGEPTFSLKLRTTHRFDRLQWEAVPAEDVRYSKQEGRTGNDELRFLARRKVYQRGQLVEMGIDAATVEKMSPAGPVPDTVTTARYEELNPYAAGEWATQELECWWAYVWADGLGRGKAQLWRMLYAGNAVHLREERAFIPYAWGVTTLRPFRLDGVSMHDRLRQTVDVKTGALRQWMDNLSALNDGRTGLLEAAVDPNDWYRPGAGGGVPIKRPDAVVPYPVHDAGPAATALLAYQDKTRSEAGGASLDLQSAEAQIAGHTAGGTERQYTSREKLTRQMGRTAAATLLRQLYRLVHRVMRTEFRTPVELKRLGEWQTIDPREWRERSRLDVRPGKTRAERLQRAAALDAVRQDQEKIIGAGLSGILSDPQRAYRTRLDWLEAMELEVPEKYYIDPSSEQARTAAQRQAQRAQAQQAQSGRLLEMSLAFERWKEEQENQRHATDARIKALEAVIDAEVKEADIVGRAAVQLATIGNRGTDDGNDAA